MLVHQELSQKIRFLSLQCRDSIPISIFSSSFCQRTCDLCRVSFWNMDSVFIAAANRGRCRALFSVDSVSEHKKLWGSYDMQCFADHDLIVSFRASERRRSVVRSSRRCFVYWLEFDEFCVQKHFVGEIGRRFAVKRSVWHRPFAFV
jgi:hypothetical protein